MAVQNYNQDNKKIMDHELIAPSIGNRIEMALTLCWEEGDRKMEGIYYNCGCIFIRQINIRPEDKRIIPELCVRHRVKQYMPISKKTLVRKQGYKYT